MSNIAPIATPASVLAQALYDHYQIEENEQWPFYIGTQPDTPESCVTFFDTNPIVNKKSVDVGDTFTRPGVQIRIRGVDYSLAWRKIEDIRLWCDTIYRLPVRIEEENFTIHNISQSSGVINLGRTEDKLFEFSLNVLMTIN